MSFFESLFGRKTTSFQTASVVLDISAFSCGHSRLDENVSAADFFSEELLSKGMFKDEEGGFELGAADGKLDYIYIEVARFPGSFTSRGKMSGIGVGTTEADVIELMGEPYWTDRRDGEAIQFYVYGGGDVELQFEYSNGNNLSHLTLSRRGVLSDEKHRLAYGVTKPWPP